MPGRLGLLLQVVIASEAGVFPPLLEVNWQSLIAFLAVRGGSVADCRGAVRMRYVHVHVCTYTCTPTHHTYEGM